MSMDQNDWIRLTHDPGGGPLTFDWSNPVQMIRHGFVAGASGGNSGTSTGIGAGVADLPPVPDTVMGAHAVVYTEIPVAEDTNLSYTPLPVGVTPAATTRPAGVQFASETLLVTFADTPAGGLYFLEYRNLPINFHSQVSSAVPATAARYAQPVEAAEKP